LAREADRPGLGRLVERRLDPADRRSFLITLTETGRATIDATLTEHAANLARLISPLTPAEAQALEQLLKTLLRAATRGRAST
jgi:DNA-binding MarR family transcriptional regulator